ncbi:thiol peroxidase [Anaerosphaera multitolerans]|uniref:Thiol peroxidase n=1 Tax=Anaerosphaera multitolerans TaxID=2487351 RepID=A0A437SA71_9FIRM|nr:thiol peroxidase [Anaerosphaera multitolerans]RVU55704.1 thiol peroxidase [Anaerosphaera multitolerans]
MNVTFGGDKVTLVGEQVKVGEMAPEFKAVNLNLSEFNSKELEGKVVVYSVVPSIDTGVCSIQTKFFNEEASKLGDDVAIVTVSVDLPFAQKRFCAVEGIESAIVVSDYRDHEFGKKYGFLIDELKLLSRGIVIVDRDGKISYVEYVEEVTHEVNFDKALEELKKLI